MAFRKRYGRPAKKRYVARRRPLKRALRVKKRTTVKLVKKVMERMAEKKVQVYTTSQFQPFSLRSGTSSGGANLFPMTPVTGAWTISQSSAQGGRVGNRVRTHRARLSINMTSAPYDITTNPYPMPQYVRLWFVKYKPGPTELPPTSSLYGATANFFQNGSTNSGFTGTFTDLQQHVNTDMFTLYRYVTYKIAPSVYTSTNSQPGYGNNANNDFKLSVLKNLDITNLLPKQLVFNDSDGTTTSHCVALIVQLVAANGLQQTLTARPVYMQFNLTYTYTDD